MVNKTKVLQVIDKGIAVAKLITVNASDRERLGGLLVQAPAKGTPASQKAEGEEEPGRVSVPIKCPPVEEEEIVGVDLKEDNCDQLGSTQKAELIAPLDDFNVKRRELFAADSKRVPGTRGEPLKHNLKDPSCKPHVAGTRRYTLEETEAIQLGVMKTKGEGNHRAFHLDVGRGVCDSAQEGRYSEAVPGLSPSQPIAGVR